MSPFSPLSRTQEVVHALISSGLAVRNVSMASNDIGDEGAVTLARLLDDEPAGYRCVLSTLDLRGNNIGAKGCQVIVGTTKSIERPHRLYVG